MNMNDHPFIQDNERQVGDEMIDINFPEQDSCFITAGDLSLGVQVYLNSCTVGMLFLPTIEDHIEDMISKGRWQTHIELDVDFRRWVDKAWKEKKIHHGTTYNEMWCMFRMSELHGLTWSEKGWKI